MWRDSFYGLLVGTLALAVVPSLWDSPWAVPCAAVSIPILAILGFFIGRALDAKDEIEELTR
jgi:hypothetical protein